MTTPPTTPQTKAPSVADYEKLGQQLKPFTIDDIKSRDTVDEIQDTEVEVVETTELPLEILEIKPSIKKKILLSIEQGIYEVVDKLSEDKTNQLPDSKTGIMVYYLVEGIKRDYNKEFDRTPISCRKSSKTVVGTGKTIKDKLDAGGYGISKSKKNELIKASTITSYLADIASGTITEEEANAKVKEATEQLIALAKQGVVVSSNKTKGVASFDWKVEVRGDKGIEDDRWKIYQRSGVEIKVPHIADAIQQVSKNVSYQRDFAKAGLPNYLLPELSSFDNLLDKFQKLFPKPATEIKQETEEDGYLLMGAHITQITKTSNGKSMKRERFICLDFENEDGEQKLYLLNSGDGLFSFS
jgi:hypothetical protein